MMYKIALPIFIILVAKCLSLQTLSTKMIVKIFECFPLKYLCNLISTFAVLYLFGMIALLSIPEILSPQLVAI